MKHLLMILDHFPPAFAPRMGYLCKYLKDMGWDAVAISMPHPTRNTGMEYLEKDTEHHLATNDENYELNGFATELYGFLRFRPLWSYSEHLMYHKALTVMKGRKFDAILCSTASFFPLYSASRIAQENNLPLLIDLRDIYEQDNNLLSHSWLSMQLHKMQIKKRNKILAQANAVATVSTWHKELLSQFNSNTTLIFNGFDESLFSFPQPVETDKFTITYTGSIRQPGAHGQHTQSPELLFQAIGELIESGFWEHNAVRLRFFSDQATQTFVKQLAAKHNLPFIVQLNDWRSGDEIPQILADSNLLLLLLSEDNTHGILTTKLFEYMASNREILCIPNSGGEMEKILTQSKAGCCINTLTELCNYLKFKYNEWQKKHFVEPHTERDFVVNFSRERQAMQFVNILNQISKQ